MNSDNLSTRPQASQQVEESIRLWWMERFGEPVPEEVRNWLRNLIRTEVGRQRVQEQILDDATLKLIYESRRLCHSQLENVEDALTRIRLQKDRLRKFQHINTELDEQQNRLYQLNKELAAHLTERTDLERFEEFEAVNGRMQRIRMLTEAISKVRARLKILASSIEQSQKLTEEAEEEFIVERGKTKDAGRSLETATLTLAESERMTMQAQENERQYQEDLSMVQRLGNRHEQLRRELQETTSEVELVQKTITGERLKIQALEVHRQMIQQSKAVQILLDEFWTVRQEHKRLIQELNEAENRQDSFNEQLGRLFSENQSLNGRIHTKKEEAVRHRQSIAGQDSYQLQRRSLEMHSRKVVLETALSLWKSIATGYGLIEQKEQRITQLRLHADHLQHEIDALATSLRQTTKQLEQKNYQMMLTKSQNVIELRGDLIEGTACAVCGATHHPWQGETITEQNALLAGLKSESELLKLAQTKEKNQLQELQTDLTETLTRLKTENEHLQIIRDRQLKDTDEWQNFCHLDRSLMDCSPSTNREARTTLIGLLIEKTNVDAQNAEHDLNEYTLHLRAISSIGAEVQELQQESAELAVQLNETNTACQVMAREVERLKQQVEKVSQDYRRRFETLEQTITIPSWLNQFEEAPETLKMRIQEMRELWDESQTRLKEEMHKEDLLQLQVQWLQQAVGQVATDRSIQENHSAAMQEQAEKARNSLEKMLPGIDGKSFFTQAQQTYNLQQEREENAEHRYIELQRDMNLLEAERNNLTVNVHELEEKLSNEQRELDIWMQQYNNAHPPVQMSELERILADDKEWGAIRQTVRQLQVEWVTTENRVEYLRAQIIALQAEGLRPMADHGEEELAGLQEQFLQLQEQQRTILRQLVQYDLQIQQHETARSQIG